MVTPRKFSSFLVRWWHSEKSDRLTLEHIQSGRTHLAGSIEDAIAWLIEQQSADPTSDHPPDEEPGDAPDDRSLSHKSSLVS